MNHDSRPRAAVFLDRDGVLVEDRHYIGDPDQVALVEGAARALVALHAAGFLLAIVSNQSGVGRGLISSQQAVAVHGRLVKLLYREGVSLDGAYYCPHDPADHCSCRKPSPGLILQASQHHGINVGHSYLVGDKLTDIAAGNAAGCRRALLLLNPAASPGERAYPDACRSWTEVTRAIISDDPV